MSTLQDVLDGVVGVLDGLGAFAKVVNGPDDQANAFPAAWVWFGEVPAGGVRPGASEGGFLWADRRVVVRVLVERNSDLPTEYGRLVPFVDAIPPAFAAAYTLGGACDKCLPVGHTEPGQTVVGATPCVTFDWFLGVKQHTAASFAG
jgi:hypothetical protein